MGHMEVLDNIFDEIRRVNEEGRRYGPGSLVIMGMRKGVWKFWASKEIQNGKRGSKMVGK